MGRSSPIDFDPVELAMPRTAANTSLGLAGSHFVHIDATGLLPSELNKSTASRKMPPEADSEGLPGMWHFATAVNRLAQTNPVWSFASLGGPWQNCSSNASICHLITTDYPDDALVHHDYGGVSAVELFRVARLKERVWVSTAASSGQPLHAWTRHELEALSEGHAQLAGLVNGPGLHLLSAMQNWKEPLQRVQQLQDTSDCSWARKEAFVVGRHAATLANTLLASGLFCSSVAVCLGALACSSYRLWWWAHRHDDTKCRAKQSRGTPPIGTSARRLGTNGETSLDMVVPF